MVNAAAIAAWKAMKPNATVTAIREATQEERFYWRAEYVIRYQGDDGSWAWVGQIANENVGDRIAV
jgi:hypothetical protein